MKIRETIVVEGRDDTAAIKRSLDALTIETHGYGIRPATWQAIEKAYETTGIIVFTDPDHAGEQIRRKIIERFPKAKEAFLPREEAVKRDDIGIENATPQAIREALEKAHATAAEETAREEFTSSDMCSWGLEGCQGASQRREMLGKIIGVGFANSKTFLQRINRFGISREEIEEGLRKL